MIYIIFLIIIHLYFKQKSPRPTCMKHTTSGTFPTGWTLVQHLVPKYIYTKSVREEGTETWDLVYRENSRRPWMEPRGTPALVKMPRIDILSPSQMCRRQQQENQKSTVNVAQLVMWFVTPMLSLITSLAVKPRSKSPTSFLNHEPQSKFLNIGRSWCPVCCLFHCAAIGSPHQHLRYVADCQRRPWDHNFRGLLL